MAKRIYPKRQPRVGDKVVAMRSSSLGDFEKHYEYEIIKLGHGYVTVVGERMPIFKSQVTMPDGSYIVYEEVEAKKPKEIHVKHYKFLGIPLGKRTTKIYK